VALIGLGHAALDFHLPGYAARPEIELVAGADPREEARSAARARGLPHTYADYREMLDRERPEFVSVLVPAHLNEEICADCFARGMHVHCEKPLALDLPTAQRIVAAADGANVALKVCFNYRFFPDAAEAQRDIAEGVIGQPYFIDVSEYARYPFVSEGGRTSWGLAASATPFWGSPDSRQDAGRLIWAYKAVHYVDLARFWSGDEVARVMVEMGRHGGLADIGENFCCALLTMTNGCRVKLTHCWGAHGWGRRGPCLTAEVKIEGEEGSLWIERVPEADCQPAQAGLYRIYREGRLVKRLSPESPWPPSFASSLLELVQAVREGREPMSSGRDALRVMEVVDAGYASAAQHAVVRIGEALPDAKNF
jgi:predicted dehydrogenase